MSESFFPLKSLKLTRQPDALVLRRPVSRPCLGVRSCTTSPQSSVDHTLTFRPLISGFINENTDWRWTFYVILIWSAVTLGLLLIFVRETFSPELLRRKAVRMRKETGEQRWVAPIEQVDRTFSEALKKSIKTPFGESTSHTY